MDEKHLKRLRAAFQSVIERQQESRKSIIDLEERVSRLERIREECVGNRALLEEAIISLKRNGIRVRRARDNVEAINLVLEELSDEKILIKSKSNISREIGLTEALSDAGIEVVETDIGDRIVQITGDTAVHPTGPSAHMDRFEIALALESHLGVRVEPEPSAIIEAIREDLLPRIEASSIGLTGVNAITSSEGALVFVHNEGNIDLVSKRKGKLIVLAVPEKIYPNLEEAINMVRVETFYATGQAIASFISVVTGPSRTADIEKEVYPGVHGPGNIVVIFVDNGRESLAEDESLKPLLRCIGCGSCILECPIYESVGPSFGSPGHLGGAGVCFTTNAISVVKGKESGLTKCLTCRSCVIRCPVSLDIPRLMEKSRFHGLQKGLGLSGPLNTLVKSVINYSNPYLQPNSLRDSWAKNITFTKEESSERILFYAGCSLSYVRKDVAASAVRILEAAGFKLAYLAKEEGCCGSTVLKIGKEDVFLKLARENIDKFNSLEVRSIVTVCPGCLTALKRYSEFFPEFDIPVRHITELIFQAQSDGRIRFASELPLKVTFHDPCQLARENEIIKEPRKILELTDGIKLLEMERSGKSTMCCGSGGGVKTAHPELAIDIGRRRMEMATRTGAQVLVTCCPWCEINLSEASTTIEKTPRVMNILSLIEKKMR